MPPAVRQTTTDITLYFPSGDGVKENSHTATYKSIKNFKNNGGVISFETVQNGLVTFAGPWRMKQPLGGVAPAGNRY